MSGKVFMGSGPAPDVTQLLVNWSHGDQAALEELIPLVYGELRRLASAYLRHERSNHTLQSTALVHEAFIRLVDQQWGRVAQSRTFLRHRRPNDAPNTCRPRPRSKR